MLRLLPAEEALPYQSRLVLVFSFEDRTEVKILKLIVFFCSSTPRCFLLLESVLLSRELDSRTKALRSFLAAIRENIAGDHISQLDKLKLVKHIDTPGKVSKEMG